MFHYQAPEGRRGEMTCALDQAKPREKSGSWWSELSALQCVKDFHQVPFRRGNNSRLCHSNMSLLFLYFWPKVEKSGKKNCTRAEAGFDWRWGFSQNVPRGAAEGKQRSGLPATEETYFFIIKKPKNIRIITDDIWYAKTIKQGWWQSVHGGKRRLRSQGNRADPTVTTKNAMTLARSHRGPIRGLGFGKNPAQQKPAEKHGVKRSAANGCEWRGVQRKKLSIDREFNWFQLWVDSSHTACERSGQCGFQHSGVSSQNDPEEEKNACWQNWLCFSEAISFGIHTSVSY